MTTSTRDARTSTGSATWLDGLGWDDREPEVDAPVEPIREALRSHIERERPQMESHDADRREGARVYVKMCENLLAAITP